MAAGAAGPPSSSHQSTFSWRFLPRVAARISSAHGASASPMSSSMGMLGTRWEERSSAMAVLRVANFVLRVANFVVIEFLIL